MIPAAVLSSLPQLWLEAGGLRNGTSSRQLHRFRLGNSFISGGTINNDIL